MPASVSKSLLRASATAVALTWALALHAQAPSRTTELNRPVPLLQVGEAPVVGGADLLLQEINARRALEVGLVSLAREGFGRVLSDPALPAVARNRVVVDLATALLADDLAVEAESTLNRFVGPPTAAVRLRRAMAALRLRRVEDARALLAAVRREDIADGDPDLAWYNFARGQLAEAGRDFRAAGDLYQQALEATASPVQRGWFTLAVERSRISNGTVNEAVIANLRQTLERNPGRATGYAAVTQLAIALQLLGRRTEAVTLLQTQLSSLPRSEAQVQDEWRLLLGVIGGATDTAGRQALRALVSQGADRDKQRAALRLLAEGASSPARLEEFRVWLDEWIGGAPAHPLLEELLYTRARLALVARTESRAGQAERDGNRILNEFPGSRLRVAAFETLAEVAWQGGFYRNSAALAARARDELSAGPLRSQLAIVVAEAYFRARDFRNAADAYAGALNEVAPGVSPGELIFQRAQALIEAEALVEAQQVLDAAKQDPRFDVVNRWQAEWNLARALQVAGQGRAALSRVNELLQAPPESSAVTPELRARMGWLQMRLSYEVGAYGETIAQAEALLRSSFSGSPALRAEISSTAALTKARATLARRQAGSLEQAFALLRQLRVDFPQSEAAVFSYLVEADAESEQGHPVEAQKLLRKLADEYRSSPYAPYALYQAASYAERRGAPEHYREAYRILEELVKEYPSSDLVFYARLKQGNLLRLLNDYGGARTLLQDLTNFYRYEQVPDAFAAQLALADCYAADESISADRAAALYERLLAHPAAPLDLRLEAGYRLGLSWQTRQNLERSRAVWWQLVNDFLLDDSRASKLGAKGRHWMARTILFLAKQLEDQGRPREALPLYRMLIDRGLPGVTLAEEGIVRCGGGRPNS